MFLILLDLSAAFDTVDHNILLTRLEKRFGVTGSAIDWIKSYLHNRKHTVVINNTSSSDRLTTCNVPQGSVLGPEFFSDYGSPLADLIRSFGIQVHLYADDTKLYLAFKPGSSETTAMENIETCIEHVRRWMTSNFLKLNDDKTEFIIVGSKQQLTKVSSNSVRVGDVDILHAESVKNIGAWFDSSFKLDKQISMTCRSAWHHIRNIEKVGKYLCFETTATLFHAVVTTKLDQNNSLLVNSPKTLLQKLQKVQNAAAKLVSRKRKFDSVTPLLQELHWLPIEQRIQYKVALLVYKSLNGCGPLYLAELLKHYSPAHDLRSAASKLLFVPKIKSTYMVSRPLLMLDLKFGIVFPWKSKIQIP